MTEQDQPPPTPADRPGTPQLARRLEHLFATVPSPSGGGAWTNVEMAQQLEIVGLKTSPAYISMLRHGRRENPSLTIMTGIANVFGVPVTYFYDNDVADRLDKDLELLVAVRRAGMERIALRASKLSPRGIREVGRIVDAVRRIEGIDDPDDSEGGEPHDGTA